MGVKKLSVYGAQCAAALNSFSKCIPVLIIIMPQWQSSKHGLYSCRYEQRQLPPFYCWREIKAVGERGEQRVNSRAVLVNYWGKRVIKHSSTS